MTLKEFNEKQIIEVEMMAGNLGLMQLLNLNYDVKAGAARCLKNDPFLKGVSLRELVNEVMEPGSFRRLAGAKDL